MPKSLVTPRVRSNGCVPSPGSTARSGCSGVVRAGAWFDLTHSVVSHDHPHHALLEEAITIDFVSAALPPGTRVAVELTLESAKELSAALAGAIAAAEIEESHRFRPRR